MRLEYERDTKLRYRDKRVASNYDRSFRSLGIKNFRTWLVAWHERKIVRSAISKLPHKPLRLADIPCGTGKLVNILTDDNAKVVSGDVSAEMISIAQRYSSKSGVLPCFAQFDIAHCPFKNSIFHCVVTLRLMHRAPKQVRKNILEELERISSHYVIISYGIVNRIQKVRRELLKIFLDDRIYDDLSISEKELTKEINEAGLHIIKTFHVLYGFSREVILLTAKKTTDI